MTTLTNAGNNMKYQFQIVGNKQFEYIMGEGEFETAQSAVEAYKALTEAYTVSGEVPKGIPEREFNAIYDQLLNTGKVMGDPGVIGLHMSPAQKTSINELKKGLKRIKSKSQEPEIE